MVKALALRYHETGEPLKVLRLEEFTLPAPQNDEVLLKMLAAPVHPSDFGTVSGTYGSLRSLPATAGREGIGRVIVRGAGVKNLSEGQRVRIPPEKGTWCTHACVKADGLIAIPDHLPDIPASQAFVNPPTAVRLLRDFASLKPGDWIIQNAATSAVGMCIISLARHLGLRTINLVRNPAKAAHLTELGADAVFADENECLEAVRGLCGKEAPQLGLNSIGGESVIRLIRAVGDGGTVVTFGGMSGDKVRFPTRNLIFNDVSLRGFWMDRWYRQNAGAPAEAFQKEVFELLAQGVMTTPVDSLFGLQDWSKALGRASEGGRSGKVLFSSVDQR